MYNPYYSPLYYQDYYRYVDFDENNKQIIIEPEWIKNDGTYIYSRNEYQNGKWETVWITKPLPPNPEYIVNYNTSVTNETY